MVSALAYLIVGHAHKFLILRHAKFWLFGGETALETSLLLTSVSLRRRGYGCPKLCELKLALKADQLAVKLDSFKPAGPGSA